MRVPTDQIELERLVRRTRSTLAAQVEGAQHIGPMSRLAVSCFPDFLTALSAELRAGTFPPFIESAVMTLVTNMLLALADTAAEGDPVMLRKACDAYLKTFINAYADKAAKLCGISKEAAAHTADAPAATQ